MEPKKKAPCLAPFLRLLFMSSTTYVSTPKFSVPFLFELIRVLYIFTLDMSELRSCTSRLIIVVLFLLPYQLKRIEKFLRLFRKILSLPSRNFKRIYRQIFPEHP